MEGKGTKLVIGWKLDRSQRDELLARFPPAYAEAVADHVTLKSGVDPQTPLPDSVTAAIIGRVDDGDGVEAMIARLDGSSERPGGGTYHITWSLGPGRRARESNDAIAAHGWKVLPEPVPVRLEPALFSA